MRLYEREPAAQFDDAHLLGNGRLGASVYGGVPFEEILINDDTLWSGSERYRVNDEFYDCLMEARKLALAGDVKQANDLINDHMEGTWGQAYMPLTSALICVGQVNPDNRFMSDHADISSISKGSCMEMTLIRELFTNTLKGAEILGIEGDALNERMRAALPRLSPYTTGSGRTARSRSGSRTTRSARRAWITCRTSTPCIPRPSSTSATTRRSTARPTSPSSGGSPTAA